MLQLGQSGFDRVMFRAIAGAVIDRGFYLRERELSYFGVEDWERPPIIRCVVGKGEVTCLYSVCAKEEISGIPMSDIFPLVDFVFSTMGAGVGILVDYGGSPTNAATPSRVATDLRTGRRGRIRVTQLFSRAPPPSRSELPAGSGPDGDAGDPFISWVERTEAGRGSSSLGSMAARTGGIF
jgi:hypothetical protein